MKRLLSFILTVFMLCGILSLGTAAWADPQVDPLFSLGDADGNGVFDARDALALKAFVVYGSEINTDAADFNADGKATAKDAYYLKAVFAGVAMLSDFDSDAPVYNFTIAGNPISDYEIVLPEDVVFAEVNTGYNDNCSFAAEILQHTLREATGFSPKIVIGESAKPHKIYIYKIDVDSPLAAELDLGIENYLYEVKSGDLHIYGTLRGTMYAVYEILENYLGIRYYSERYTYFPKMRTADIPEGTRIYHKVPLEYRFTGQNADTNTVEGYYFPRRMNSTSIYAYWSNKYGFMTGPVFCNAHSYADYYLMGIGDDPGPDYPDIKNRYYVKWHSKMDLYPRIGYDWQPCASPSVNDTIDSENPSEYAYMFQGMLEALQMMKDWGNDVDKMTRVGVHVASASINDNGNVCNCSICAAKANGSRIKMRKNTPDMLVGYTGEYEITTEGNASYITFKKESYSGVYLDLTKRFGRDIQEYYPGLRVMTIIYDHTVPESIRPDERTVLEYCGHSCNAHPFGSGQCNGVTMLGSNNAHDEVELKAWSDMCHAAGTTIWFWEYGVNYHFDLAPCPNVMDFWQTIHYILVDCKCDGFYYEGSSFVGWDGAYQDSEEYNFENLKSYLAARMMWYPEMTYEEFLAEMNEFLYMYYGNGYEYIYDFIQYQQAAGDATGICCIVNYDRPWEMYSPDYIRAHYEEARECIDKAVSMAKLSKQKERCERLYLTCDFLGLSASYDEMYTNGTAEQRAVYEQRYTDLWTTLTVTGYTVFSDDTYDTPEELDFTVNPMIQFYGFGSRRGIKP